MTELPGGDLLAAWYSGTREGHPDVAIICARRLRQNGIWTRPEVLVDTNGKSDGNPLLFTDAQGRVWLFYVTIQQHGWSTALPYFRCSEDGGNTWSDPCAFCDEPGTMFRCRPIRLGDGRLVLPAYDEKTWQGLCFLSDDEGNSWRPAEPISAPTGSIQPAVVELSDGSLLALLRTGGSGGYIWQSRSFDRGETWTPCDATQLFNPNSGIDMIRCTGGELVLAFNHSRSERTPLGVALSEDEGYSWPLRRMVESAPGEYSYPALLQSSSEELHLLYTWRRRKIRHVSFTLDDLRGNK